MSSRVRVAAQPGVLQPVQWRTVSTQGTAAPASQLLTAPPAPDPSIVLAEMEQQCQQRVRDAHAAGLRDGEAAGRTRASAELQPVMERLTRSAQEIANLRSRLRHEAEADVVQLAIAIARRVVRREISADPEALRGLVVAALERLQGQEISRVKVHPAHVVMVKAQLQQAVHGGQVEVLADASREPGSVIFETSRGNLDASVDSQLNEIERGLADRLRRPS